MVERFREINPETCEAVVSVGDYVDQAHLEASRLSKVRGKTAQMRVIPSTNLANFHGDCDGGGGELLRVGNLEGFGQTGRAWQFLAFEDPIWLNVAEHKNQVDFEYQPGEWSGGTQEQGCLLSATQAVEWDMAEWSGWELQAQWNGGSFEDYWGSYFANAFMFNSSFCAGLTTHANFEENLVDVWPDGGASFQYTAYVSGACSWMLSLEREIENY